uniref:Sprouty-related, EVH1 domain-containing protein 2-like isoform X2 n=1 Tax=Petromyzon marinus TaxID=7757 RepID=A0AAJ7TIY7_PETMA|nr:sprouty-related, EVH1 domain-containing protein 2-like isoform X2 [Petromyzon marinus]
MNEECSADDENYIVRVRAVVMTRDDSTGGWVPLAGGGISRVGIYKVLHHEETGRNEFLILGERLKDKLVVLECVLKKDVVYNKVTPIFHHWKIDEQKFGLTFQSPADARAFDRGVRKAIEDLSEGSTTSSSTLQNESEVGDDDVFTTATDSSSASSRREPPPPRPVEPCRGRCLVRPAHEDYRHMVQLPSERVVQKVVSFNESDLIERINPLEERWLRSGYEDYRHTAVCRRDLDADAGAGSYVTFDKSPSAAAAADHHHHHHHKKHEYTYPYVDAYRLENKLRVVRSQPRRGHRWDPGEPSGERARCIYCGELFDPSRPGRARRCADAPDRARVCVERASCLWLAETVLYHCMSDPEGDFSDPCSCDGDGDGRVCQRWFVLAGLSLLAPCMCCYLPLRGCYSCGVACGCCGGKHRAVI